MDDVVYDTRNQFVHDVAPHAAAYHPSGAIQSEQPPWASSIVLCVGTKFSREHIVESFIRLCRARRFNCAIRSESRRLSIGLLQPGAQSSSRIWALDGR